MIFTRNNLIVITFIVFTIFEFTNIVDADDPDDEESDDDLYSDGELEGSVGDSSDKEEDDTKSTETGKASGVGQSNRAHSGTEKQWEDLSEDDDEVNKP